MLRETTYRDCAVHGASPIGLLLALYDRLVLDLRNAAHAIQHKDIENRCKELNHALLIVGQLESWINRESGGESAENLVHFYSYIRAKMFEASVKMAPRILEDVAGTILHVRSAWQQLDGPVSNGITLETQGAIERRQSAFSVDDTASNEASLSLSV